MNRRSFLRGVLLGASALALPGKGKAAEPELAVSAELADGVEDVDVLDSLFDETYTTRAQEYMAQLQLLGDRIVPWLRSGTEFQLYGDSYVLDTDGEYSYYLRLRDEA